MNINFELYRTFYEVAKEGNITKASERLIISQPAVSKSIKNLETQLGGKLFVRTKKGVLLTEEGKVFYEYIKNAIDYINNAENRFTDLINLESGTIKIGVNTTLAKEFLIPYVKLFHDRHPKVNIQIFNGLTSDLISELKNGLVDMVILNTPYQTDESIKIVECKKIHDIFVTNKKLKNLTGDVIALEELNDYPLLLQHEKSSTRMFLDSFCKKHGVTLKPAMTIASYSLITEFSKIGLGLGYATKEYVQKELDNNELYEIKVIPKIPPRSIGVAFSSKNIPSFSTKEMLKIILEKNKCNL